MPISDAAVVGAPIIDQSHFAEAAFKDDFTGGLSIGTSATPGARDGKWKRGFYASNITVNGAIWGSDSPFGPAQINQETQKYPDPKYPHPDGWSGLAIVNSQLRMRSELVDTNNAAEVDWAKVKGFELNADGSLGNFRNDLPVKYKSEMLTTYGRFSMSFGRTMFRVKLPTGADGASADINLRSAIFAAVWGLEDVPYEKDINGEPHPDADTTHMPGKRNRGGVMTELDDGEGFGESETDIHQTTHLHFLNQSNTVSNAKTIDTGKNTGNEYVIVGRDVFPEKIVFFIDGEYTHEIAAPPEIADPMALYEKDAAEPWLPALDPLPGKLAKVIGAQQHSDGSPRYMQFCILMNLARDGKYPRDLARQIHQAGGTLPPHTDTAEMWVDEVAAYPLVTDNPDKFGIRINGVETETPGAGDGVELRVFVGAIGKPGSSVTLRVDVLANPNNKAITYDWKHDAGAHATIPNNTKARTTGDIAATAPDDLQIEFWCDVTIAD